MSIRTILAAALVAAPLSAQPAAPLPRLTLAHQTALRCSTVFALVAADQARGLPYAAAYPRLGVRGREFFVRTTAKLMDDTGATRAQVTELARRSLSDLQAELGRAPNRTAALGAIMRPCLSILDGVLPGAGRG
jgi:hypothetical protein